MILADVVFAVWRQNVFWLAEVFISCFPALFYHLLLYHAYCIFVPAKHFFRLANVFATFFAPIVFDRPERIYVYLLTCACFLYCFVSDFIWLSLMFVDCSPFQFFILVYVPNILIPVLSRSVVTSVEIEIHNRSVHSLMH